MSFLKNTISLLAIFTVIPAAFAVTARPSVMNTATAVSANGGVRRMPTMTSYLAGYAGNTGTTGGTTGGTTSSTLLENAECIDAYTQCIKGGDACGANFEECTTRVLFHAKMPQCLSTLAQCAPAGINSLFGTSTVSALSNVATQNSYGEVTEYTYPTDGSVLGQMITAAAIENKYDTSSCVRRYSSCLRKDSVCGADFELCTTNSEFKKQRVFCDSTLARCQSDGLIELFGTASMTATPSASSRVGEMIAEGAALAAVNAVSTCYKVVDQCILNACTANPYKCFENTTAETVNIVDAINNGTEITAVADSAAVISKSDVSSYIKNSCLDTIGSNKYCYATFLGDGQMPTSSQLRDEDNQEEVYDLAYGARYNSGMRAKITDLVNKFDTRAKEKCIETIKSCAMRTCGGGSGAACYAQVFGANDKSINNEYTRNEIKTGCQAVINTDANCKYAAQNPNASGTYSYSFMDADAFDVLFPEYDDGAGADPIGVIAALNGALANNYSDAAIAQMKKQCQSVATSCVKSMCGNDYVNCYRNRTDIYSSLTNSGDSGYDKSMNKVGGVLDYTIVLGLCVDTVKNADVCSEHLAIEANKLKINKNASSSSWGTSSVRSDWIDAGATSHMEMETETVQAVDENGNDLCTNKNGDQGVCYTVDASGAVYDTPVRIAYTTYVESQAASTLFKDLIYDLEIEAQAKYNAKLTKEQNMCLSSNNGGIIGNKDTGSTFMWVKLKSNKVPSNYSTAGLKTNQFVASNDLYGSFCRVRVTLHSDDKDIQDAINSGATWSTAYFAAGDAFTCGSWIPSDKLQEIAEKVGERAGADAKDAQPKIRGWMTALGVLGGGAGGAALGSSIYDGDILGGLTGKKDVVSFDDAQDKCAEMVDKAIRSVTSTTTANSSSWTNAYSYATSAERYARKNLEIDNATAWPADIATFTSSATTTDRKTYSCGDTSVSANAVCVGTKTLEEAKAQVIEELQELKRECMGATKSDTKSKGLSKGAAAGIGAGVTAIAGGILAHQVTDSVLDAEVDKAEREAIAEFMDNVGSKIRCFVGGDEVGMYGDMISTSIE